MTAMPLGRAVCERQPKDSTRRARDRDALVLLEAPDLSFPLHVSSVSSLLSYAPAERTHGSTRPHKAVGTSAEALLMVRYRTIVGTVAVIWQRI